MVLVDQTAVPLTLPAIMRHYDIGSQSAQWVLSGSLVALAAALGTMGGIAAVAGAAGPVIGGVLTATLGWQSVFLVNVPLAAVAAVITRVAIPRDTPSARRAPIDLPGAGLLAIMITAFIVGLAQSQNWGWASPAVLLAIGGFQFNYWFVLPGLLAYGAGLAVVLTVNDPVSLSDVPDADHGQAAGVSATAEQFGGSLGIAVLYLIFHTTYVAQLHAIIDRGPPRRSGRRPVRPTPRRSCRRRKHRLETQAVRSAAQPLPGRRRYRSGLGIRRRVPRRHAAGIAGVILAVASSRSKYKAVSDLG